MNRGLVGGFAVLLSLFIIADKSYGWYQSPEARIVNKYKAVCVGQTVNFDAEGSLSAETGSYDPDNGSPYGGGHGIDQYDWSFPSGASETSSSGGHASCKFNSPGVYYVWVDVTDDDPYPLTSSDYSLVRVMAVASVSVDKTTACVGEAVTFTANSNPSGKPLSCIEWQKRYRPNSSSSWGSWSSASGGDNTAILSTTTAGVYQYRARNGSADTWKESSEVTIIKIENMTFNPKVLYADGTSTATASATITPSGRTITWSIQGNALGCNINSSTGIITAGTTEGTITVRAADSVISSCYAEASIDILNKCLQTEQGDSTTISSPGAWTDSCGHIISLTDDNGVYRLYYDAAEISHCPYAGGVNNISFYKTKNAQRFHSTYHRSCDNTNNGTNDDEGTKFKWDWVIWTYDCIAESGNENCREHLLYCGYEDDGGDSDCEHR